MKLRHFLITWVLLLASYVSCRTLRKFPENFLFGVSSSAYQSEGAWNEDGRGPSFWDVVSHTKPSLIMDGSTGDVTTNTYHLYKSDIQLLKDLGVDFFKLSISWSRILPTGFVNKINQAGINFYNNFIDELIENNITPIVNIHHFDPPAKIQEMGGWINSAIIDLFTDYARVLFENFGDRVKLWMTINEPSVFCNYIYGSEFPPPFVNLTGIGEYMCAKNVLLAHAKSYHLYNKHFRKSQKGKIGITLLSDWFEPLSDSIDDHEAALEHGEFQLGLYAHPIFSSDGDFPPIVKRKIEAKSREQGFPRSRLPELTPDDIRLIKGSADFMGVNSYSTKLMYRNASVIGMYPIPSLSDDIGASKIVDPSWPKSIVNEFQEVPWGFYKSLMKIKELYNNPIVYIIESGWTNSGGLEDNDRIQYLNRYLHALLDAIDDGCDIRGYSVWSFMDYFEWVLGYYLKFGLYEVDFSSPNLTRTARKSAHFYKQLIKSRMLERL